VRNPDGKVEFHYCLLVKIYKYFNALNLREMKSERDVFNAGKVPK